MTEQLFLQHLGQMPDGMKQELLAYFEYLLFKYKFLPPAAAVPPAGKKETSKRPRTAPKAGFLKGTFVLAKDFNLPLEDFKSYMP